MNNTITEKIEKKIKPHNIIYFYLLIFFVLEIIFIVILSLFLKYKYIDFILVSFIPFFIVALYWKWLNYVKNTILITQTKLVYHENDTEKINIKDIKELKIIKKGFLQNKYNYGTLKIITEKKEIFINFISQISLKYIIEKIKN